MATSGPRDDHAATPPVPPPKPGSHDASRMGTPSGLVPPPPPPPAAGADYEIPGNALGDVQSVAANAPPLAEVGPDPGDTWLPALLQDKS